MSAVMVVCFRFSTISCIYVTKFSQAECSVSQACLSCSAEAPLNFYKVFASRAQCQPSLLELHCRGAAKLLQSDEKKWNLALAFFLFLCATAFFLPQRKKLQGNTLVSRRLSLILSNNKKYFFIYQLFFTDCI